MAKSSRKEPNLSRQKLVRVYSTNDELDARMVQGLLRQVGIESMITGEALPSLYPVNTGEMARRDVFVLESQAGEASRIISEHQDAGGELPE